MKTGMKLTTENYTAGAIWCNENGARINPETNVIESLPALTTNQKKEILRVMRNGYLFETDKYMLSDFPATETEKERIGRYRQYLRDLPQQKNFPEIGIVSLNEWK